MLTSTSGDTEVWGVEHNRNDGDQSLEISVHSASVNGTVVPDSYHHTPTTTYTAEDERTPPPSLASNSAASRNYNRHIHSSGSTPRLNSNAALSQDFLQTLGLHYRHGSATNDRTTARGDLFDDSDSEIDSIVPISYRATHNQARRIPQHQRAISVPYYRSMPSSQDSQNPRLTNGVAQFPYEGAGRLRSMSLPSRKAILQLDFLIIGGGEFLSLSALRKTGKLTLDTIKALLASHAPMHLASLDIKFVSSRKQADSARCVVLPDTRSQLILFYSRNSVRAVSVSRQTSQRSF